MNTTVASKGVKLYVELVRVRGSRLWAGIFGRKPEDVEEWVTLPGPIAFMGKFDSSKIGLLFLCV